MVYNVHPTATGELLTGRVLDGNGDPVGGATVTATCGADTANATTDEKGIYAVCVPGGRTWLVSATALAQSGSRPAYVWLSGSAICLARTPSGGRGLSGTIGNSWGNDITLGVDVPELSFNDALDASALAFTTGGVADWFVETSGAHDGEDAARSGSAYGTLTDCMLSSNAATGNGGGAYSLSQSATLPLALTRCTITNNTAVSYGVGSYYGTLVFCHINDNSAGSGGGACDAELTDCTVSGNVATNSGGGVYNGSATRCGIVRNRAVGNSGGGSYGAALVNCVVVYNEAESKSGGGAYSGALTNCTVFANSAASGGGVYFASIANCIVWGNDAQTYANVYASTTKPCLYSCLGEAVSGDLHVGNIVADPLFVDGVHGDYHLQTNSPCINAGLNDLIVGETDFYGDPRIVGGRVDMGASEFQFAPSSGYAAWAADNGLGAADALTEGQPNLIRYVFNRPSGSFSPFTGLTFQNGNPVVWFQSFNTDVTGVSLSVISTTNLLDWTHPVEFHLPGPPFDFGSIILNHADTASARFYKLRVEP